ncbi:nitrite/sulfite reductase [Rhodobacter maris]|uniref:Sulfite reductase (NADPH) hemoprotein beta-component n=1 Tax=Rhodobacter maris TaxID=446682 RepID=A0A285RZL8_9RHOB|nr:nitrite/sulfite reductase [Rhodobacter maris]SOB99821.1 sulfite reductase (NADPH) hemoprotein beta-component [Rhodobacter maris]
MYDASEFDTAFLRHRAAQFRNQVERRLSGSLTEDEFKPLRLMNGVYLQLHAYMLRVAIPYGTLSADQMRVLAEVAERWDRGYGHFTTRQNIQFNWVALTDIPDILERMAEVGLHAIQSSGNCVRNTTADAFAGAAADEIADPRPYAELIRQWSTDHAEFQFLPRKFKIAVTGSTEDRAAIAAHDVGLQLIERDGDIGFRVLVGGGLGRTPMLAQELRPFLPSAELLPYLEAVLAAYNLAGRRDNKYKARIKITVFENGIESFRAAVEEQFARIRPAYSGADQVLLEEIKAHFALPELPAKDPAFHEKTRAVDPLYAAWAGRALSPHKRADYAIVTVAVKTPGEEPGDVSAAQMRALADIAERWGRGELRVTHMQNVVLPHVAKADLPAVHEALRKAGLAAANIGRLGDVIACPGMDYCALATARSIPLAQEITKHFQDLGLEDEIGTLNLKISGCINACGHHHLGHIGILGLDRAGVENYQITIGGHEGDATFPAAIGEKMGPGFAYEAVVPALERLLRAYLDLRAGQDESFLAATRRLGLAPFRAALYGEERDAA